MYMLVRHVANWLLSDTSRKKHKVLNKKVVVTDEKYKCKNQMNVWHKNIQ